MAHLTLSLLGPLEVKLGEESLTALATSKARALLAYLAVEADRPHRREVLAGLLWPDYPEHSARTNLRNTLSNLRKAIGDRDADPPFLLVTRETIQLNAESDCWIDVGTFSELVQERGTGSHHLEQAMALYRGPFLQGFTVSDSSPFEDWALVVQERLERQVLEALQSLTEYNEEHGAYVRAREHARRRVALAPWQEQAHQDLMRLLALSGQRGAALAQYEACRRALREELDVEPGEETTRLYARIRDGELGPPKEASRPPDVHPTPVSRRSHELPPSAQEIPLPVPPPVAQPSVLSAPGPAPLAGERRIATVLIADVKGSTALAEQVDVEAWVEMMNEVLQILSAEVYRYGGEVDQFRGDGLVAFFGVSAVHEDDPERAVLTALAMQEGLTRYAAELADREGAPAELLLRVGVNTGEVIAATVGDRRQHSEQTAMGRAIALAARMETAAEPGTVLVAEQTHRLVAPLFEWQALGEIAVKGYSEPVSVYRPLARAVHDKATTSKGRGIAGLESSLVGRGAQFRAAQEAIERLRSGIGGIVTVVGEAGIGKSRLVAEVRNSPAARPAKNAGSPLRSDHPQLDWIEGRCLSYAANIAYHLWLDMLRGLLGEAPDAPLTAVRQALQTFVQDLCPDCFEDIYPFLGWMMALPLDDATEARLSGLGAEGLKVSTFGAVEALIERAALRRPQVIVCEDLHWADPTSIELLERVLSLTDRTSLLLICVFRPETEHGCWQIRETAVRHYHHRHTDLRLDPLSLAESETLIGNLLYVQDLPQTLALHILGHAEGNPFYIEEILRSLIDSGAIEREEVTGRWRATRDAADIAIPGTLHGMLAARIDRLPVACKRVLQIAAVIGRIFARRILFAIAAGDASLDEQDLNTCLLTLQRTQMIRERARLPEAEYIFKHQLTQEAAYHSLLRRERRAYHRGVAEAMERLYPNRVEEQVELLAHHWERDSEPGKAVYYFLQAGDRASRLGASLEAIDFYQAALRMTNELKTPERSAQLRRIYECLGDIYLENLSRHTEALEHFTAFLSLAESEEDCARGERKVGGVHLLRGNLSEAQECFDRALAHLGSLPPLAEASRVHFALAYLFISRHQPDQAARHADASLNISRQVSDTRGLADAYRTMSIIASHRGDLEARGEFCEHSLALYRELGDLMRIAQACNNLGDSYRRRGLMDRALERLEEGLEIARRIGDTRDEALLLGTMAELLLDQGRWEAAIPRLEQALALAEASGVVARRVHAHRVLGSAYERTGRLTDARHHLEMAQTISRETRHVRYTPRIYLDLAHLSATEGAFDQAQRYAESALAAAGTEPSNELRALVYRCYGYLSSRRGDWDDAVAHLQRSLAYLERGGFPVEESKVRLSLGTAFANRGQEGDRGRACEQLLKAVSAFDQIEAQGYLAQAESQLEELRCRSWDPGTMGQ